MSFFSSHNSTIQSRDCSSELDFATLTIKAIVSVDQEHLLLEYWQIPSANILTECLSIYQRVPDQQIDHVLAKISTNIGHHLTDNDRMSTIDMRT